jgi:hypothetical protein
MALLEDLLIVTFGVAAVLAFFSFLGVAFLFLLGAPQDWVRGLGGGSRIDEQ